MLARTLSMVLPATVVAGFFGAEARAGGLNDWSCAPGADRPYPVVLVHGRGGSIDGFGALVAALGDAGHCVFAANYGQVGGQGQHGVDHLWISGEQLDGFVAEVLAVTGAERVDLIGHSAGTGVIANYLLARGGAARVHRAISFGGLHHPYAHAGAPGFVDNDLFLPNLIAAARVVDPDVTAQEVITAALALYTSAGGSLAGIDVETATSNFASDLFDPDYWAELHGGLSEPPATFLKLASAGRSVATADAAPGVCYTNIVGVADLITGPSAGFQDEAPNVDNFLLVTPSDHVQILSDPIALGRTLAALATECRFTGSTDPEPEPDDGTAEDPAVTGCSAAGGSAAPGALLLALLLAVRRRR